jgi:predicted adenine nucleotide alpha hydrolase (AANH) superfamily ATPase
MAKILLHICCGPCASACIERLRHEGFDVTLFFSNANIAPRDEYELRRDTARRLAEITEADFVEDTDASHQEWLENVAKGLEGEPEGGARCRRCFAFNMSRAAAYAKENGFEKFTTSLTVSPHKRSATVFEAGREAGGEAFAEIDFKKRDGFKRSVTLAAEYGLYRQSYCGCEFSLRDRSRKH